MLKITRRSFIKSLGLAGASLALPSLTCINGSFLKKKPNVVFILVDDLGYMDIGANNPDCFYETPYLDNLAAEGMRFSNGYAACPVCSPTRYSIMTGKYPTRIGATNFFSGTRSAKFNPAPLHSDMPVDEVTMAESLKQAGYKTAFLGKWHLGPSEAFWPEAQGFDINIGGHSAGMPRSYFSPYSNPKLADGPEGEYLTSRLTDEAIKIIEQFKDDPFFLYLAFYTVHIPLQAPEELIRKYEKKAVNIEEIEFGSEEQVWPDADQRSVRILQKHATYAAMVESMDYHVGRLLGHLKKLDLDGHTIVCFMSDNGGLSTAEGSPTSNIPLRGGKGWIYEGGIREPWIIKWPGVTRPGSTCHHPVISTDFYPTLLEAAGLPLNPQQHLDGVSLVPLLEGKDQINRESLFWHYPHYSNQGGFPGGAIREGDFKLVERYEDGRVHLYNLKDDIGEKNDLAASMPDRVNQMCERLHKWYNKVDAKFLQEKEGRKPWKPDHTSSP
ncbi:sulfatase-like hydrolase/transferase [bacterium]|nr:sulfatase-like hydrolase/transferase [bacterium]